MVQRFFIPLLLICSFGFGQSVDINRTLEKINREVKRIHDFNYGQVERFRLQNFPMDSVFISVYSKNKKYEKIYFEGYNGISKIEKLFYLQDSELIYLTESILIPETPQSLIVNENGWEVVNRVQNYFNKNVLIRQLDSEDGGHPFSRKYLDAAGKSLLDDYKTLILLMETDDLRENEH